MMEYAKMDVLDSLSNVCHQSARSKGFWDGPTTTDVIMAKLALIHSEVSELLESIRKNKGSADIADEFADILIRTFDLYAIAKEKYDLPELSLAVASKIYINQSRPQMHGHEWG